MGQSTIRGGMVHRLGPYGLISDSSATIEESRRIREWLLGILRFAVTLERPDQAAVICLAVEMDRLGATTTQSRFSYFTRTSIKLCYCILATHDLDKLAELYLHVEKIDDLRLRRAFEGALFAKRREYLWKGLAVK